jgi:hypothetical protein
MCATYFIPPTATAATSRTATSSTVESGLAPREADEEALISREEEEEYRHYRYPRRTSGPSG